MKIIINGAEYEVAEGTTVLRTALDNGIYIPHFCYHPYISLSGNCRMCLVEIKPGPPGKLTLSCNTPVAEGMEVNTDTPLVQETRRAMMEFILKNHPLDCPICDQAGECILHTYYMDYDLQPGRVRPEEKIRKRKALRIGPLLVLDTERCILCGRCVRYMKEVAGDDCLIIANRSDHSEISLFPGRNTIDNPYSMNLVDVCPVGAWTSADFRFKQRVWFLTSAAGICPGCSRGCNLWIDFRGQEVFRFRPRENPEVNKCWLCDRGRLLYHALNDGRLCEPRIKNGTGQLDRASWEEALAASAQRIKQADKGTFTVIVSASLTLEEGRKALALFRDRLSARMMLWTGPEGPEDNFLRRADQNANTRGLSDLGITEKAGETVPQGTVVVLETVGGHPLPAAIKPTVVISPSLSPAVKAAEVALPAASYVERGGTFVNFEGRAQSFKAALPPPGQALPYEEILQRLERLLG